MTCSIKRTNGRLMININGKDYCPLAFKSFRPTERNISDFYNAGIRLFNVLTGSTLCALGVPYSLFGETWLDDEEYDFSPIDNQIELFRQNAPDAYLSVMIQLDTREWWLKKHENYPDSFTNLAQMEADENWRDLASKYMQAAIEHIEEKYGEVVFGYFILCGTTTEWFSDYSHEEPTPFVEEAYKRWCGNNCAVVPIKEERETEKDVIFLNETENLNLINYRKFTSGLRAETIEYFFEKAQEILNHKKLMGLYFGYIFELAGERLWECGHLDYERIFKSPNIDMISSPMAYMHRTQNCGSQQMITDATLDVHNKIYFLEHDQTTCIVPDCIEGTHFTHPNKAKTIEEDINLLRRDFLLAFKSGVAMWWFDMFEGWWYHPSFMSEIKKMIEISNLLSVSEYKSESEIAVIVDPQSMYYINKNSGLNTLLFNRQRTELSLMGAPYDLYSVCDVMNIDTDRYKLFVFLSSFKITQEMKSFIDMLKKQKKAMLFSYACDCIGETFDTEAMKRILGIDIVETNREESVIVVGGRKILCDKVLVSFDIRDDASVALATYENGDVAAAYKENGYITALCTIPPIKKDILRQMMELANVHCYTQDSENIVYVNNLGLGIYHCNEKDALINLKEDGVFVDVFEGKEYVSRNSELNISYSNIRAKLLIKKEFLKY